MSDFLAKTLVSNGLTNQNLGFTDASITSKRKEIIGVCKNLKPKTYISPKGTRTTKYVKCGFETTDRKLENCKHCDSLLVWRVKVDGSAI